ncbi:N-acetylglucosamine-6-phosphate deacetylase [Usitatibacter palustris]|uniref:N-acetylglucosamine-6-phosphate deacetylase n=1 Tax=Usitatibacter palustris TaxID=2732487 RepID=A0A6M4HAX3_9PROT|nr:N-acetylglucosamine-6-phosphate deacetylase [Usitatibacter palustris]QJR16736.1 N-acetylglucosamine-6-phosphate deacetylase [Usitatibacter palustris]
MREALANARVLTDDGISTEVVVLVANGRIEAVVPEGHARVGDAKRIDLDGHLLLPGFVDTQVNGGGGALFNDDPSVETIRRIGAAHRRFGTTSFLPTLISDDVAVIARAIAATREAIAAKVPGVIGVHIEGPCLNEEKKGAHDSAHFRSLDASDVKLLSSLATGRTLVTLAPEMTTPARISELAKAGVVVSAGHTNATYAQINEALAHGLTGFTHLFNAMSPLQSREPGVVGAALDHRESYCGIIVDGHHVDPVTLKIAMRAKRADRFILVTDAMPNVGANQDFFMLQGRKILVRDGLVVDENGVISGSALDMASAVRNAMDLLGLALPQAVRMASTYPAQFMGLDDEIGRIAPGYRANFVLADERMNVIGTWIDGSNLSS